MSMDVFPTLPSPSRTTFMESVSSSMILLICIKYIISVIISFAFLKEYFIFSEADSSSF